MLDLRNKNCHISIILCLLTLYSPPPRILFITMIVYHVTKPSRNRVNSSQLNSILTQCPQTQVSTPTLLLFWLHMILNVSCGSNTEQTLSFHLILQNCCKVTILMFFGYASAAQHHKSVIFLSCLSFKIK